MHDILAQIDIFISMCCVAAGTYMLYFDILCTVESGTQRERACVEISICVIILISIISSFGVICKEGLRKGNKICSNCTKKEREFRNYIGKLQGL